MKALVPVSDQPVVGAGGAGAQRGGVGAGAGLGQAVGAVALERDEARQVAGAGGLAAPARDHPGAHVVDRDEGGDGGAGLGQRLEDEDGVEAGEAGAALVLGHVHGGEAEGAGLGEDVARDALGLPGEGEGRDALAAEAAGHVADRRLLVGEGEVHRSSRGRRAGRRCRRSPSGPRPAHSMVGIEKAAPSLMPEGQRAVTVLVRV